MDRPIVYAVCGRPGAGKTTLARKLEYEDGAVRFSADEWVERLYGPAVDLVSFPKYRRRVWEQSWVIARRLLELRVDVVLDFSFWHRTEREDYRRRAEEAGADFRLYYLECAESVCRERLARRNVERPAGSFEVTEDTFDVLWASFEEPGADEAVVTVRSEAPAP